MACEETPRLSNELQTVDPEQTCTLLDLAVYANRLGMVKFSDADKFQQCAYRDLCKVNSCYLHECEILGNPLELVNSRLEFYLSSTDSGLPYSVIRFLRNLENCPTNIMKAVASVVNAALGLVNAITWTALAVWQRWL